MLLLEHVGCRHSPATKSERDQLQIILVRLDLLGEQSELALLGYSVAESTVAKYMVRRRKPPSQTWRTFLENHVSDIAAIGLVLAFGLTRLMSGLLFGVSAADPITYLVVAVGLIAVALTASYLPARRAASVDPITVLRTE